MTHGEQTSSSLKEKERSGRIHISIGKTQVPIEENFNRKIKPKKKLTH